MQNAVQREIGAILVKVHRIDFGQTGTMPGGASLCMRELTDKLGFIKSEILNEYNIGELGTTWLVFPSFQSFRHADLYHVG